MKPIMISSVLVLACVASCVAGPNILFIMSDDHATNAVSCYGGTFKDLLPTPNIDRLAAEGVRLHWTGVI